MKRIALLSFLVLTLILTACSNRPTPVVTTPAAATTPTADTIGTPTETPSAEPVQTYTVERGMIQDIYSFTARITPIQYTVTSQQDGIVQKILVSPGQSVQEGDLIVQLDVTDLQAQLDQTRLANEQSQRLIDQAAQNGRIAIQQAQLNLEAAQEAVEQAKVPPSRLEITQAQTAIRESEANLATVRNNASQAKNQAKADMEKAVVDLQNLQQEYAEAVTALNKAKGKDKDLEDKVKDLETQLSDAEAAVQAAVINYDTARNNEVSAVNDAQAKLDLAKAQLEDLLKGPDKFVIAEKERAVRSAELAVSQARNAATPDPALIQAVESGELLIEQLEEQIIARQVIAPGSGKVVDLIALPGDPLQIGSPVLTLGDESRVELVSQTTDMLTSGRSTVPALTIGQSVEITFARYPGMTFEGTISQLASLDGTEAGSTYRFTFNAQGKSFAPGDQADMKIVLQSKEDVLFLPPEAVNISSFRSTVTLAEDGDTDVNVQIGITTADKVEIVSGLNEGDVVLAQ
jgi:HlyD family secretion protein